MPTMIVQTAINSATQNRITGFGPNRASASPPTQDSTAAAMAAMIPKTPIWITVQSSTSVA